MEFAKEIGGIDYAIKRMDDYSNLARNYIENHVTNPDIKTALNAYLEFVAQRNI